MTNKKQIDKLKKELDEKKSYLENLEELEIPPTEYLHNWLHSLRANNYGIRTVFDVLSNTETNKKLYRQKLILKWDELVCDGFCIPWQVYHYCDSYLQSSELDNNCDVYGYDEQDKQEYKKEIEAKQKEAENAMELIDDCIISLKGKINFIENEINKIEDF